MKIKFVFLFVFTTFVYGCAGLESAYRPWDITGGYGDEKISDSVFMVFFDGNGFTTPETAKKYFLRRSAQLTLKNGQDCFVILDERKTLHSNYSTQNKAALNSKYYSATSALVGDDINKPDENSQTGLIQLYKLNPMQANCINAEQTLKLTSF